MKVDVCAELRAAIEGARLDRLDEISKALWRAVAAGAIQDEAAGELGALLESRRAVGQVVRAVPARRVRPRANPAESKARARRWAASGRLPPRLAALFTPGEQAALAVMAWEAQKRGSCSLAIGAVAALAGVSVSTVKRALRAARAAGLLQVQERRVSRFRNETNVVRIVSAEWLSWLRIGKDGGGGQRRLGMNTGRSLPGKRGRHQPQATLIAEASGPSGGGSSKAASSAKATRSVAVQPPGPMPMAR